MTVHKTVLLKEAIDMLNLKEGDVVVDATLGGGGHSREVLLKIGKSGKLIAFDRDIDAIRRFEKEIEASGGELSEKKSIVLFHDNYSAIKDRLASIEVFKVDAIIADLGISSDQLADEQRGISFLVDAPLDMRMDQTKGITASDVVNTYDEQSLVRILNEYGDEKYARSISHAILKTRSEKKLETTFELIEIIERSVPGEYKRKKNHYATKTFQALRMEVNQELESLRSFLVEAVELLVPAGRLSVITFHSGEDTLVKHLFRENARGCICPPEFPICQCGKKPIVNLITRKAIDPSDYEIKNNPRARSAKLRVIEKNNIKAKNI